MIEEFVDIYLNEAHWHKTKLSKEEAKKYYQLLYDKQKLIWYTDNGSAVGLLEYYNITYEQLKKLERNEEFHIAEEDIDNGNICYVSDVWIHPNYRNRKVSYALKNELFKRNKHCRLFTGKEVKRNKRWRYKNGRRETDSPTATCTAGTANYTAGYC